MLNDNICAKNNSQSDETTDCAACDIGLYAGPDAQFKLSSLSKCIG